MPEIKPDLSDKTRCVSVHWTLPVQCVLPPTHREDHEAWHPHTGNRMRYCRTMGAWRTEELHHGEWHDLKIPPPGGYCGDPRPGRSGVSCTQQYGHGPGSWTHTATVDGCRHTWNTPIPRELTGAQLREDVRGLRAAVYRLSRELEAAEAKLDALGIAPESTAPDREYGIRVPADGDNPKEVIDTMPSRREADRCLARYRDCWPDAVLVERPVWRGGWKPAQDGGTA